MSIFSRYFSKGRTASPAGFTLVELMVVLAIILIITVILLTNNSRFNSAVLLRNFAYQVGLSIREAQLYGVAVKGIDSGGTQQFPSYGVHFASANTGSYVLFADLNGDGMYSGADSVLDTFAAQYGFTISDFCVTPPGGAAKRCVSSASNPLSWLDITFVRPDPEAHILSDACTTPANPCINATVTVASPGGSNRLVSVTSTGLISVTGTEAAGSAAAPN